MKYKALILVSVISLFIACNSKPAAEDAGLPKEIIGNWIHHTSTPGDGYDITTDVDLQLLENGTGNRNIKMATTFTLMKELSNSFTLQFPISWQALNINNEPCIIIKTAAGTASDLVGTDTATVSGTAKTMLEIYKGVSDTLFYTIQKDNTVKWHLARSIKPYELTKKP